MQQFEFNESGECDRCRREAALCRTGVCKSCLDAMVSLRDGPDPWAKKKRLRELNAAENGILRSVKNQMALETHQATPSRALSFPKMLKERDARKTQQIQLREIVAGLFQDVRSVEKAEILLQATVKPYGKTPDGDLIRAIISPWRAIVERLKGDWNEAYRIPSRVWEELIAAAFEQDGYDEVILTPRSGDHGRDVIANKKGVGCIRIIDSVKAYAPHNLVKHDDVRALAGVLLTDHQASKGIVTTTSDFAPGIKTDPFLAPLMPYRLELMSGKQLLQWLKKLSK
jgi:restriction system protein